MKYIVTPVLSFLVFTTVATMAGQPAGPLGLDEIVRRVLQNNPAIRAAADAEAQVEARVEQSRSPLYPAVRGEVSYARLGPAPVFEIPDIGSFQLFPYNNYDVHVAARQLLFDFRRTREAVRLAQAQMDGVRDRRALLQRDLEFQAVQVFYTILCLQQNVQVQNNHVRLLNEHLVVARKKVESGTATELDILTTQVRLTTAQNQELELENELLKQQIALNRLMGVVDAAASDLQGDFSWEPQSIDSGQLLGEALRNRVEIIAIDHALQAAQVQQTLAGLIDKPSLHLSVAAGIKNGYIPDLNKLFLNFVAGVQGEIPIADGFRSRGLRREAEANILVLRDQRREVENAIRAEVLQASADLEINQEKLALLETNIRQAEKALEFARTRYEAGTMTNLDLIDTEEALTDARFLRFQAIYRCILSRAALERAAGIGVIKEGH